MTQFVACQNLKLLWKFAIVSAWNDNVIDWSALNGFQIISLSSE